MIEKAVKLAAQKYLLWRRNKDEDDCRGYSPGIFTKLRHYTQFGAKRAESLEKDVKDKAEQGLYHIVLNHLSNKHSKLHNHSLDTYLLEQLKNIPSLQTNECLRTIASRERYRKEVIDTLTPLCAAKTNKPSL
jgi:hypothetical protein